MIFFYLFWEKKIVHFGKTGEKIYHFKKKKKQSNIEIITVAIIIVLDKFKLKNVTLS